MELSDLLSFMISNNASDLHLSPTNPPIVRVDGNLKRVKGEPLSSDTVRSMLFSVMTEEQRAVFDKNFELDFAISFSNKARFRVNAFMSRNGTSGVLRIIPNEIKSMEDLGVPPIVKRLAELESGLVLVVGPTGGGKTTTLASIIDHINTYKEKHILTIEDPVEYFHKSNKSLINHRELGTDTKSFSGALRSALREDPDVILVGEMRDPETIALAMTAAETGHLVFGTLHASSAPKTIDRIIDSFSAEDKSMIRSMLSSSLQGVIAQILLPKPDGVGRIPAFEIMLGTNPIRNQIRENKIAQIYSMIQTGKRYGMVTMADYVNDLANKGLVNPYVASRALLKAADEDLMQTE